MQHILQDTDSVFMRFECRHPDGTMMTGLDAVRESMRLSMEASRAVSDLLPQPQELSYEKASFPTSPQATIACFIASHKYSMYNDDRMSLLLCELSSLS